MATESARESLASHGIREIRIANGLSFWIAIAEVQTVEDPKVDINRRLIKELNGSYPVREVDLIKLGGFVAVIEEKHLLIPGKTWPHEDSRAQYFLRSEYRAPGVRGYYLSPGDQTSLHSHGIRIETIHKVSGDAKMLHNNNVIDLNASVRVEKGEDHMIEAGPKGAVIVVVTEGPGDCLEMTDHHRKPKPQIKLFA